MGSPADFDGLLNLVKTAGSWRPAIGAVLALDEVVEAHALMESRRHTGKIVLTI